MVRIINYKLGDAEEKFEYQAGDSVEVRFDSTAHYYLDSSKGIIKCDRLSVYTNRANSVSEIMVVPQGENGTMLASLYFDAGKTYAFVIESKPEIKKISVSFKPTN
ncbi:hypothetical protein V6C27_03205 [Peptococcaceae bacterium 1198_IL3148]